MTMTSYLSSTSRRVKPYTGSSILLAVLTTFSTTVSVCGAANATDQPPTVTYQLSGSAPVADYISYQAASTQIQQAHVPLPWSTQYTVFNGQFAFVISAQSPGSITCTILLDGKVVSQATANGAPARTVCSS
jgi:Mycobacterium membrane protein